MVGHRSGGVSSEDRLDDVPTFHARAPIPQTTLQLLSSFCAINQEHGSCIDGQAVDLHPCAICSGCLLQTIACTSAVIKLSVFYPPIELRFPFNVANISNLAGALQKWRRERSKGIAPSTPSTVGANATAPDASPIAAPACERIVVFSKRDLVPEWGIKVSA